MWCGADKACVTAYWGADAVRWRGIAALRRRYSSYRDKKHSLPTPSTHILMLLNSRAFRYDFGGVTAICSQATLHYMKIYLWPSTTSLGFHNIQSPSQHIPLKPLSYRPKTTVNPSNSHEIQPNHTNQQLCARNRVSRTRTRSSQHTRRRTTSGGEIAQPRTTTRTSHAWEINKVNTKSETIRVGQR